MATLTLLQIISVVLLISSAQVRGSGGGKKSGGGSSDSTSAEKWDDGDGIERIKCKYGSIEELTCQEGLVIEFTSYRIGKSKKACRDPTVEEEIKKECDGKSICTLKCNDILNCCGLKKKKKKLFIFYECVPNRCSTHYCANGGRCVLEGLTPTCQCSGKWTGQHCDVSPREAFPCETGQICVVHTADGTPKCCPEGDQCSTYYCANGGTCVLNGQTPTCQCSGNWTGDHCDASPCDRFPCKAGQICVVNTVDGTPKCCPDEASPCDSITCQNNGVCLVDFDSWTGKCCCPEGYVGDNCETVVTACTNNPCKNGGTCKLTASGEAQCTCAINYGGPICEYDCATCPVNTQSMVVSGKKLCYFISIQDASSWEDAKARCERKGLILWEPTSDEEVTLFYDLAEVNTNYWIGGTDLKEEGKPVYVTSGNAVPLDIKGTNDAGRNCLVFKRRQTAFVVYQPCTRSDRIVCGQHPACDA